MAKLHELLAVEGDLSGASERILNEATVTFANKSELFSGHVRKMTMLDEARAGENTTEENRVDTTVDDKLKHVRRHVGKYYDALLQKESSNQDAVADLIIDGNVVASDVPATFLLGMESRLKRFRAMIEAVPTLRPGLNWQEATDLGEGVWRSNEKVSFRTEKTTDFRVMTEATEHHPAQIDKWTIDKPVGRIEVEQHSGMITPSRKSLFLTRIDTVIAAVKKARQRANTVEVKERTIAKELFDFIFA